MGVVCVGQDVFSQKEMVREHLENLKLKEINIAKDAFLACMSHEMRTPLNGLLGMLQARYTYHGCAHYGYTILTMALLYSPLHSHHYTRYGCAPCYRWRYP